jgi:ElaB/YqjD/DUF883 family membrane-anchored ribosome-binding protein
MLNGPTEKTFLKTLSKVEKLFVINKAETIDSPKDVRLNLLKRLDLLERNPVTLHLKEEQKNLLFVKSQNQQDVDELSLGLEEIIKVRGSKIRSERLLGQLETTVKDMEQHIQHPLSDLKFLTEQAQSMLRSVAETRERLVVTFQQKALSVVDREYTNHMQRLRLFFQMYPFYSLVYKSDWVAEDMRKTDDKDFLEESEHFVSKPLFCFCALL